MNCLTHLPQKFVFFNNYLECSFHKKKKNKNNKDFIKPFHAYIYKMKKIATYYLTAFDLNLFREWRMECGVCDVIKARSWSVSLFLTDVGFRV